VNRAFIFIGTNIDRRRSYQAALLRLSKLGIIAAVSPVYQTAPVGIKEGRDFYNGAVLLETDLSAHELKRALRQSEDEMGRIRTSNRNSPRVIDLDLVLFNSDRIDKVGLHIPDPLILKRPFLPLALAQLAPDYVHPTDGRTLEEIARSLGGGVSGAHVEPIMTAIVKELADKLYRGEISHA
jgi:2-amino-4-hydroxy-6-hydroxymethyldihydropteridine diphosphokinase